MTEALTIVCKEVLIDSPVAYHKGRWLFQPGISVYHTLRLAVCGPTQLYKPQLLALKQHTQHQAMRMDGQSRIEIALDVLSTDHLLVILQSLPFNKSSLAIKSSAIHQLTGHT